MAIASGGPIARVERLAEAGPMQRSLATASLVIGAVLAAAGILLFDWHPGDTALGALVGTAAFGAVAYLTGTAKLVPRGALPEAPPDVEVEPRRFDLSSTFWLIGIASLCVPVAWLLDRWDVGAAVVPGQPFGSAAAALLALVRIRRWERGNGRRVLYDPDAEDVRPYAGAPL